MFEFITRLFRPREYNPQYIAIPDLTFEDKLQELLSPIEKQLMFRLDKIDNPTESVESGTFESFTFEHPVSGPTTLILRSTSVRNIPNPKLTVIVHSASVLDAAFGEWFDLCSAHPTCAKLDTALFSGVFPSTMRINHHVVSWCLLIDRLNLNKESQNATRTH